ncbi:prepilin-type N-terminal cleavage/methylation domain-containing protein [Alloiococcus sp. CFN-8]|uniref:prepilin-type N-terminal cleavage/methylation domain-containing protein n=1 Tax=Alloiococcus sp. CFN-8 TaxID=3416081 RepID=UPI003CF0D725
MWKKSRRGASLIEVIIALAILIIIINMILIIFSFTTKSYGKLKTNNERLNVVEFISKNILHSYSYEDLQQLINSEVKGDTLFLESGAVNKDIKNLTMVEIVQKYKNNTNGDIEITFTLSRNSGEIKINCNTYGNTLKTYIIKKRTYEH